MFVLRVLLMLVVTGESYATSPVQFRKILGEESFREEEDNAMWNDAYFDRIFGLEKPAELIMPAPGPADEEKVDDDTAAAAADDDADDGEDFSADDSVDGGDPDKEEDEEVNEDDAETTEKSGEYHDYDSSNDGKSSSMTQRGNNIFTGIIVASSYVFLVG